MGQLSEWPNDFSAKPFWRTDGGREVSACSYPYTFLSADGDPEKKFKGDDGR